MQKIALIIFALAVFVHAKSQSSAPKMLGNFSWEKTANPKGPSPLKVKAIPVKMDTKELPNQEPNTPVRPINPGTIILKKGKTLPKTSTYQYGKKWLLKPQVKDAAALLERDNAWFNVSYSDRQHGFAGLFTSDFAEDSNHHIWMASDKGLIRYDGYHYYIYDNQAGLPNMAIESIQMDHQNRLWLGSDKGVFLIQNDSIFSIQTPELDFKNLYCRNIELDQQNNIWLATKEHGAICVDQNKISIYDKTSGLPSNYVHTTHVDKNGNLLFGMWDIGLVVVEPNQMKFLFSKNKQLLYHDISAIHENEQGIWLGGFSTGLIYLGKNDTLQYSFMGDFSDRIYDIAQGAKGIYCSIYGGGVAIFNGKTHIRINETNGLNDRNSYNLFVDSFENLWVADLSNGFSRLNENKFYIQPFQNKNLKQVMGLLPDGKRGNWILSEGNGLAFDNGKSVTYYSNTLQNGVKPMMHPMSGIVNPDGSIWLSSYGAGIVYGKNKDFTFYQYDDFWENEIIFSVKRDREQTIWFSTMRFGLITYKDGQFWHYDKDNGLIDNNPKLLYHDANGQVIATYEYGLQRLSNSQIATLHLNGKAFKEQVNDWLVLKSGKTLMATENGGLLLMDENQLCQWNQDNGLMSNTIKKIIEDKNNTIWITTNNGIESFQLKDRQLLNHQIFHTGYGSYILNAKEPFLDSAGNPYWSLGNKKLLFDPEGQKKREREPIFRFTDIWVDGLSKNSFEETYVLPDQKLTIHFSSIFWGREQSLEMGYLIISIQGDSSYRSIGKKGEIQINDLVPNTYKILLVAKDGNKLYYSKPIWLNILNFWYNRWGFRVFMFLILLGAILYYFKSKQAQQEKLNQVLEQKVAEQTEQIVQEKEELVKSNQVILQQNKEKDALIQEVNHRVKNNLQFMSAMVQMQSNTNQNQQTKEALLETNRRINAMSLVHEMLYHKMDTEGLYIDGYLKELINQLKELTNPGQAPIVFNIELVELFLDSKTATSLGMIVSELVSNSIEHAFKETASPQIKIQLFSLEDDQLCLIVKDNGTEGPAKIKMGSGLGTRLIDIFCRQLEGEYQTQHHHGFEFKLVFKYRKP
jgi:two-component sensor histidine kinase/ligand-binding sensor domain-containing protein